MGPGVRGDIGPWQVRTWRVQATGDPFEVDLLEGPIPAIQPAARTASADPPVDEPDRPEPEPSAEAVEGV